MEAFKEGCRIQGHLEVNRVSYPENIEYNFHYLYALSTDTVKSPLDGW